MKYLSNYEHWPDPATMLLMTAATLGTTALTGGFSGRGGGISMPRAQGVTPPGTETKEKARADVFSRMAKLRRATLLSQSEQEPKLKKTVLGAG